MLGWIQLGCKTLLGTHLNPGFHPWDCKRGEKVSMLSVAAILVRWRGHFNDKGTNANADSEAPKRGKNLHKMAKL